MNKRVNRYSADIQSPLAPLSYGLVSLLVGGWLLWDAATFRLVTFAPEAAYWEYVAVLTEWLSHAGALTNPHVDDASLSARFMPYFWLLAAVGRALDLTAIDLMGISAVVNYILIIVGLKLFLQSYFRNAWAPLVGFVVLFMFAGTGLYEPNVYQLRSFFYVAGYPASFAFGLSLITFWLTLAVLRDDLLVAVAVPLLAFLAALVFLADPLTGVFGIVGCVLLILTEPLGSGRTMALALGALVAGVAAAELWPYFSVWKLTLGLYADGASPDVTASAGLAPLERFSSGAWAHPLYSPRVIIGSLGLSLLGLPVVLWLLLTRQQWFIVLGALAMTVPYVANLYVPVTDGPAFLLLVAVYLQLAIVWAWLGLIEAWDELPRTFLARPALLVTVLAGSALIAGNVWMASLEFKGQTVKPGTLSVVPQRADGAVDMLTQYGALLETVDDQAVVLASARAGWVVPAVKGKVVSLLYSNPLLADQSERQEAIVDFFFRPVDDMRRIEIAQRYDADYIIVDTMDTQHSDDLVPWLQRYGEPVSASGTYQLYRVGSAVHAMVLPEPAPALVAENGSSDGPSPASRADQAEARPARPAKRGDAADTRGAAEDEEEPSRSYGAPIADPMLDPERHGA